MVSEWALLLELGTGVCEEPLLLEEASPLDEVAYVDVADGTIRKASLKCRRVGELLSATDVDFVKVDEGVTHPS
jgi:hypothetical protein